MSDLHANPCYAMRMLYTAACSVRGSCACAVCIHVLLPTALLSETLIQVQKLLLQIQDTCKDEDFCFHLSSVATGCLQPADCHCQTNGRWCVHASILPINNFGPAPFPYQAYLCSTCTISEDSDTCLDDAHASLQVAWMQQLMSKAGSC